MTAPASGPRTKRPFFFGSGFDVWIPADLCNGQCSLRPSDSSKMIASQEKAVVDGRLVRRSIFTSERRLRWGHENTGAFGRQTRPWPVNDPLRPLCASNHAFRAAGISSQIATAPPMPCGVMRHDVASGSLQQ